MALLLASQDRLLKLTIMEICPPFPVSSALQFLKVLGRALNTISSEMQSATLQTARGRVQTPPMEMEVRATTHHTALLQHPRIPIKDQARLAELRPNPLCSHL